jgi:hypothetical protein
MMRRNNLLTALLLFITVTLVQVSLVNSHTSRENQSMDYSGNYEMRSASKDGVVQDILPTGRVITMKMEQQAEDPMPSIVSPLKWPIFSCLLSR